jgi:CheY-like chemotaxis protein
MKNWFHASPGKPSLIKPQPFLSRLYKLIGPITLVSLLAVLVPPLIETHNQTKLDNNRFKADAVNEVREKVTIVLTDFYRGDIKGGEALRNLKKLRRLYPMNDQLQVISTTEKIINEELQADVAKPTSTGHLRSLPADTSAKQPRERNTLRQNELPIVTRDRRTLPGHIPIDSIKSTSVQPSRAERRISPNDTDKSFSSGMQHKNSGYAEREGNDQHILDEPGDIR